MDTKKHNEEVKAEKDRATRNADDLENLGLDADHSSDNFSVNGSYNTDNDRISHNPGGEEDIPPEADQAAHSPLDEK